MKQSSPRPTSKVLRQGAHQVLDPCSLGQPVQQLDGFSSALQQDLAAYFDSDFNRRYGASFELGTVSLERGAPLDAASPRWQVYANEVGGVGFAVERCLLLGLLAYRYGEASGRSPARPDPASRPTATEERLAASLGLALVGLVVQRVAASGGVEAEMPAPAFVRSGPLRGRVGMWTVRVQVCEPALGIDGMLWFAVEEPLMTQLLRRLSPPRRERGADAARRSEPLERRLQLRLTARMLHKEVLLGRLMDLRVGDVMPVSLGATEVLVDDSVLFTASVMEHQGKLCLTAFEHLE